MEHSKHIASHKVTLDNNSFFIKEKDYEAFDINYFRFIKLVLFILTLWSEQRERSDPSVHPFPSFLQNHWTNFNETCLLLCTRNDLKHYDLQGCPLSETMEVENYPKHYLRENSYSNHYS